MTRYEEPLSDAEFAAWQASIHLPGLPATVQPLASEGPPDGPHIASDERILDRFARDLRGCGVVGEERNAAILYLALTSRLLDDPISATVKGTSSSGKSFTVEQTSRFFPKTAFIEMTAMSERALVYMQDDFRHRTLIVYEVVALREGVANNLTAYFVRSLLSEGRISYPVTVRDSDGNWTTKTIVKEGPTNVIVTTTETRLHAEHETRVLSLPTDDTANQTRRVLLRLAEEDSGAVDLSGWHALQRWLETAEHRVTIPYSHALAEQIPPAAVRLRRDFRAILGLIRTHAILHQLTRGRDEEGRIVADLDDYAVVRHLVADLVSDSVEATVSPWIRETVWAVGELGEFHRDGVQVIHVGAKLGLDKSAASRRLRAARERGYVANLEERRGRPARYVVAEPLPEEVELLPQPRNLVSDKTAGQASGCTVARVSEGNRGGAGRGHPDDPLAGPGGRSLGSEPPVADTPQVAPTRDVSHAAAVALFPGVADDEPDHRRLLPSETPPTEGEALARLRSEPDALGVIRHERERGCPPDEIARRLNTGGWPPPPGAARWSGYTVLAVSTGWGGQA